MTWKDIKYEVWKRWRFSKVRDFIWWFRYRLWPRNRYHTLKLGKPGYSDPRHQLIHAVMGIVERYAKELRVNWHPQEEVKGLTDVQVAGLYIDWCSRDILDADASDDLKNLQRVWFHHYHSLQALLRWWADAKDNDMLDCLDCWSKEEIPFLEEAGYYSREEVEDVTTEQVDHWLKVALDIRAGMWT